MDARHDGKTYSGVEYAWPAKLQRPPNNIRVIYLDLNHWIELAKANTHQPASDEPDAVLDACVQARDAQTAVFPISGSTYYELAKIGPDHQRHDLRQVIERLSQYCVILPLLSVIEYEVEAALDERYGTSTTQLEPDSYLGQGWTTALGADDYANDMKSIRAREMEKVAKVTAEGADFFAELFDSFQFYKESAILDGPSKSGKRSSLIPYIQVDAIAEVMNMRLRQELSLRDAFNQNPHCRRGRIRDYVMTRSVKDDFLPTMCHQLAERGIVGDELFETREAVRELFDSMPSCDVMVTMKTLYHRNASHLWSINDIYDIDALSAAMPYCDFVLTDKAVASQANASGLAGRLETRVTHKQASLLEFLQECAA